MKECDELYAMKQAKEKNFNPRTLWKSATPSIPFLLFVFFISIHALYERVRRSATYYIQRVKIISIHALYERVRRTSMNTRFIPWPFQSTHSMKECDSIAFGVSVPTKYFNPRTLWKSATLSKVCDALTNVISIHALYERVRRHPISLRVTNAYFNPRTLWKSATFMDL